MFEISSKIILNGNNGDIIKNEINLDENLDLFILIDCIDIDFREVLNNKIIDSIVGKINKKNIYKDLSTSIENINQTIKTWNIEKKDFNLNVIIGVLNKNQFIFSNIGNCSCYLIKSDYEVIELTDKNENKTKFNYISDGEINNEDVIVMGTKRILNYLSKSDVLEGLNSKNFNDFGENIKHILESDNIKESVALICFKYINIEEKSKIEKIKNNIFEKIYPVFTKIKSKFTNKPKKVKNLIFLSGIIVCFSILYYIIYSIIGATSDTSEKEISKINFLKAKEYIRLASENFQNPDVFEENIKNAKEIVFDIKDKELFLNDIKKILDEISLIEKQFNGVETFDEKDENLIYKIAGDSKVKIIKNSGIYVINKKNIIGPIIANKEAKTTEFDKLEKNEEFIDATIFGNDIILLTNKSKIVNFSKSGYFSFVDVNGQTKWEEAKGIASFAQNIYLVGTGSGQIYKHIKTNNSFNSKTDYLLPEDIKDIGKIESIAIDGGIYILKDDLSIIKAFSSPKYRLEKIIINKLPRNYDKKEPASVVVIKANQNLSYVYILLDNKIFVFNPGTRRFQDTKSLTYLGQIEGKNYKIIDFFVDHDGDLQVLNENGVYKLEFEVSDDKLRVK